MKYKYIISFRDGNKSETITTENKYDLEALCKSDWAIFLCDNTTWMINMHDVLSIQELTIEEVADRTNSGLSTPILEIADMLDAIDKENVAQKVARGFCGPSKAGYATRFIHACMSKEIATLEDLLAFGKRSFRRLPNIGEKILDAIDDIFREKFGITSW